MKAGKIDPTLLARARLLIADGLEWNHQDGLVKLDKHGEVSFDPHDHLLQNAREGVRRLVSDSTKRREKPVATVDVGIRVDVTALLDQSAPVVSWGYGEFLSLSVQRSGHVELVLNQEKATCLCKLAEQMLLADPLLPTLP